MWEGYAFDTGHGILGINSGPGGPVVVLRVNGRNVAWAKPRIDGPPADFVCTRATTHPHCVLVTSSPTGNKSAQLFLVDGTTIDDSANVIAAGYPAIKVADLDHDGDLDVAGLMQYREDGAPQAAPPTSQFWEIWLLQNRKFVIGGCTSPVGEGEPTPPPPTSNPGILCAG